MAERILVLGGARSGKSAVAEALVAGCPRVVYVATGTPADAEMAERIAVHRAARPRSWRTAETADIGAALAGVPAGSAVLVDALGGWLAGRMTAHGLWAPAGTAVAPLGERGHAAVGAVLADADRWWDAAARHTGGPVVVVADESGLGVTPADPSTRRWLDLAGAVLQRLAAAADRVVWVVAGRAVDLPPPRPLAAPGVPAAPGRPPTVPSGPVAGLAAHGDRMVPAGALDFAVNVHGDGPPPHLRPVLAAALAEVGRYPDDTAARHAAARRHGRSPDEVLVTAGAAEAFRLLATALRTALAAVVSPSFTEPEAALRAAGVPVVHVPRDPERDWALVPDAVPPEADLVVLGNPNNPTGTLDPPGRVAALCRPGRVTVVDEAFADFVADPAASVAGRDDLPGLVVVRSITKLWGLPGLRAGYALGPPGLVARLRAAQQPWPVGVDALAALVACCDDEPYRRAVAADVAARREHLRQRLVGLPGVRVWPSAANFLLLRVPAGPQVDAALRGRGIAVRPSTFPLLDADHLRVAVRDGAANDLLVRRLQEVLAET